MLKIGYVRLWDATAQEDSARLKAAGCQVVRAEEARSDDDILASIMKFIGDGDELMVVRLDRLSLSGRGLLEVLDRLESRGASLTVLQPALSTRHPSGHTLRAVLEAVVELEQAGARRRRPAAPAQEIVALQRAGIGPVEIARRLGVSRMTVWRKLKSLETEGA